MILLLRAFPTVCNAGAAADHNPNAIKPALKQHGATEGQIRAARSRMHKLDSEMGSYK